ncbi:hypothetical protein ABZ341_27890 [Streptomyces sp. NPDC006173]|uniref:hypothetical protein n=1 Tax=Streptomyces sp. NPDC006173 TaxID=3155349 RepID=UPI0033D1DCF2
MKGVAEFGIICASKAGSMNHNEIVVAVDREAEVDKSTAPVSVSAVGGDSWSNHNEIVIAD